MQNNRLNFVKRHRLLSFFLITYGISWGIPGIALLISAWTGAFEVSLREYSPLSYIAIWSPALSAFIVIFLTQGKAGIRAYFSRLFHWNVSWIWYAVVFLGVPLMNFLAAVLMKAFSASWLVVPTVPLDTFLIIVLLKGTEGPFDELGWRGYALPLLQKRFSGLSAAAILGFFWMLWHVPALFLETVMADVFQGNILNLSFG